MATTPLRSQANRQESGRQGMTMPEAARFLSREERFMGTVAAMNTLLIEKRIYTQEEFDAIFCDWAAAQVEKPKAQRTGSRSKIRPFSGRAKTR